MSRATEKAMRLLQIEQLLWAHPEGLTRAEIARRIGVNRSTITKYLDKDHLPASIYEDEFDGNKLKIDRNADLTKTSFNLHEIMAIHLATRLLATRTDKQNPHAASALRKLGIALQRLDQRISHHLLCSADVMDEDAAFRDPVYLDALEKLTEAWSSGRKVRVSHQMPDGRVFDYIFSPYFIEPYAVGQTAHVIGLREPPGKVRTFKIERLRSVEILREEYAIPEDFDPTVLLRDAWGIWYSEAEPVEVVLRFHPSVAQRVRETRWHREQQDDIQPDGYLVWRAKIAEPQEMLPWIRGWGAQCEVLEPVELREELKREARKLGELYQVMEVKKQFVAHIREKDRVPQSLEDHLSGVSKLAGQFAGKIGLKETGTLLGLLHDLGKASETFQRYILSGEGLIDPDAEEYIDPVAHKGKIDHTTAGAQVVYQQLWDRGPMDKIAAQVLALCIASHHSGLIDCLTPVGENNFIRRMQKGDESTRRSEALANLPEIQSALADLLTDDLVNQIYTRVKSLREEKGDSRETYLFKVGLLIRFLLSCLIDADRLDTADFESPGNAELRNYGQYHAWETLITRLNRQIDKFEQKPDKNKVDELRSQVSQACLDFATRPKGIYQLTVPTGGAKTLGSLRFALNHAAHHGMDRIFYVLPYTSIIDQNAAEVRRILEDRDEDGHYLDKVVLEHHSNLTPEEETRRQNLLAQNWDAPIVFTTQVQFLEALFGAGTRSPRRMHQLANSVIILDEVQTVPIKVIHMLNVALRFLVNNCGATVLLCTATQPPLDKIDAQYRALTIQSDQRIIQNEGALFEALKRVDVFDRYKVGGWSEEEVAALAEQQLQEKGSVLIVVNTKKSARALYHAIADKEIAGVHLYHLSTNMCAVHRLKVLDEMKAKLSRGERVICVSTQLIEAGVDIDFGAVIRYLAGLDSIAQAAGRCNRHGTRPDLGSVWIVNPKDENIGRLQDIAIGTAQAQRVLADYKNDPQRFGNNRIGIEAMAAYYRFYYEQRKDDMRYNVAADSPVGRDANLFDLLSVNAQAVEAFKRIHHTLPDMAFRQSFQSAAKAFRVIDSPTRGVVVPYGDEGKEIVADLCASGELTRQRKLLRRAQRYSVNLFPDEFQRLATSGAIKEVQSGTGIYCLAEEYYSDKFGWSDKPVTGMETLIA
ncbi:CRISPR-associated helicase Cas3' [Litorilinea aerophila]|uniref:CRISPR-associated helicase Cas3 n=1 Tax=Litorilinea aerophila TaxID=1204385 RepID=A0A540VA57_9CHLR|nr:CRISPR-associated helicase Cas3' [Litorilinea aerophila]MCC9078495.1 CRISPR-associated helicase Cas3' [Litorilinea aerophila]